MKVWLKSGSIKSPYHGHLRQIENDVEFLLAFYGVTLSAALAQVRIDLQEPVLRLILQSGKVDEGSA